MNDALRATIQTIIPEAVALRHELHRHPEIRFEEHWTSDRIVRYLGEAGIPCTRGHARGTGIVAMLEGKAGKTVVVRADMDGLEIQETTGLPYASAIPERMHACGHDGHCAALCGAAKALAAHAHELEGTVKFIFQPAEEIGGGGCDIVKEGLLEGVDAAFGLHAWPGIPAGKVGVRNGTVMASADWFAIEIQGKGCHGASPGSGVDPIVVGAHIVTALQTIVSREVDPWESGVVTVGRINAGVADNIIPETARMEGTFRALTPKVRQTIKGAIERVACRMAEAFRATANVSFGDTFYIPLENDPGMTDFAREVLGEVLGPDAVVEIDKPSLGAEDFAFYLEKVPGTFMWLGNSPPGEEDSAPLHNPHFDFNDDAMPAAILTFAGLASEFLARSWE